MESCLSPTPLLKYSYTVALNWCQENGWSDLFIEQYRYWAFPPGGVMPLPLPTQALEEITLTADLTPRQFYSQILAFTAAIGSVILSYGQQSPLPLIIGFAACALAMGLGEP